jgi:hypothetical protein
MTKNNENIFKTICISALVIVVNKTVFTRLKEYLYTLLVLNKNRVNTVNFVAFFVFRENAASFSTNICSFVPRTKLEAILFLSGGE